jgi:hypothetical protein
LNQSQLAQVLQALSQQQAALLQAHADGMRLQRVLVEQMLDAGRASGPLPSLVPELTATSPVPDAVNSMTSLPAATGDSTSTPVVPPPLVPPSVVIQQHPVEAIVDAPLPVAVEPTMVDGETASASVPQGPEVVSPESPVVDASGSKAPVIRAAGTSRGRAARYFQAHPTRPARVVTPQELGILRSVSDAGDAA